jgi:hypothetical protein
LQDARTETINWGPEFADSLFLSLLSLASRRNPRGLHFDAELVSRISPVTCDEILRARHLELFLKWVALPRMEQVDQMLPYLRTLAGANPMSITPDAVDAYVEGLIPEDAPAEAKKLFLDIVKGVLMIFLAGSGR